MDLLIALIISAGVITFGFAMGRRSEKRHLADLAAREAATSDISVETVKSFGPILPGSAVPTLVMGESVIASDLYKTWATGLRGIFGGEAVNFTYLYQRARREATVRMLEQAKAQGCNAVCNVRYEAADIGGNAVTRSQKNKMPMASCAVYGTAYVRG